MQVCKNSEWWEIFWMLCWSIWLGRNEWNFNGREWDDRRRIDRAVSVGVEYKHAAEGGQAHLRKGGSVITKWEAPGQDLLKLNVDAAFKKEARVGMGAVLRDCVGDVLMAMCDLWKGECEVHVGEAMAVRQGIKVAMEAGFLSFIIETDNTTVYHALKNKKTEASAFGLILKDIYLLLSSCVNISYSWVRREGNMVAHSLAKKSISMGELGVWLEDIPDDVGVFVKDDLPA
ncbi:uncharacterized protein LOC125493684 [Beta vulgaris subsp. vulgaris]|uniref:uncharacterized protein LOC125493684 n=1 Tax=Beta vulgaris subsp. vulgaris TaxID=3555 RepID=UPI0020375213|nr:uncharacterized protein LOC125493684 [Beta vulgaris subsp. vulgaris]